MHGYPVGLAAIKNKVTYLIDLHLGYASLEIVSDWRGHVSLRAKLLKSTKPQWAVERKVRTSEEEKGILKLVIDLQQHSTTDGEVYLRLGED